MALVLISHVDADAVAAGQLADALEAAGFRASAGRPGDPEPETALAQCDVIVLLASADALASEQLTAQVVAGYERGAPFVPVLLGVSHLDLTTQQPAWRSAIGSATSIEVPREGVETVASRVVEGVRALTAPAPRGAGARSVRRRTGLVAGGAVLALVLAGGIVWWATAGGDGGGSGGSTPRATSSTSTSPSPTATDSANVADSATTPVKSVAGNLRIVRVQLAKEFCNDPDRKDCARPKDGNRVVVLKVREWNGGNLPYTEEFAHQMDQAYVKSGDQTAGFAGARQSFDHSTWEIAYVPMPAPAADGDLLLRWPGNPTILLHPVKG